MELVAPSFCYLKRKCFSPSIKTQGKATRADLTRAVDPAEALRKSQNRLPAYRKTFKR